jgi:hypothetical protein
MGLSGNNMLVWGKNGVLSGEEILLKKNLKKSAEIFGNMEIIY